MTTSILFSVLVFLRYRPNVSECLNKCIAFGGDTDSTAAVACCLCGAFVGLERLERDIDAVRCIIDAQTRDYGQMKQLATDVHQTALQATKFSAVS